MRQTFRNMTRFAIVCLVVLACCLSSSLVQGHDKFFELESRSALLASTAHRDAWFEATSEDEFKEHWSHDDGLSLKRKIADIQNNFEATIFVEVKLVGFDGEGYRKFVVTDEELLKYLEASGINLHPHPYVMRTDGTGGPSGNAVGGQNEPLRKFTFQDVLNNAEGTGRHGHALPFRQRFMFSVSKVRPDVSRAVADAIQNVVTDQATRHEQYRNQNQHMGARLPQPADKIWYHVPHRAVEKVLQRDFEQSALAYTIYLLNPTAPMVAVPPPLKGVKPKAASAAQDDEESSENPNSRVGKRVPVRYIYSEMNKVKKLAAEDNTRKTLPTCESVLWASKRRFVFVDFTAGPVSYGPQTAGDGIFTELSLPRLDRLFHRHKKQVKKSIKRKEQSMNEKAMAEATAAAEEAGVDLSEHEYQPDRRVSPEKKARAKRRDMRSKAHEFVADLAKVVRHTAQQLITPPMWTFPVTYARRIVVNLIVISDHGDTTDAELQRWRLMTARLQDLAVADQDVRVDVSHVNFADCELCVTAFTHSLKSHTSNFMLGDGLRTQVHQYLSSAALRDWLEHFEQSFWSIRSGAIKQTKQLHADAFKLHKDQEERIRRARRGADDVAMDEADAATAAVNTATVKATKGTAVELEADEILDDDVKVVTAFVFDLQTPEVLLLDRFHQSVSFPGMVIGVQTRSELASVDMTCNGQSMRFDPQDASRPLFASLIQSLWGVAPTGVQFNPFLNTTETDYMWTTGLTPFGYFSQMLDSSFSIRDAAARNILYSDVADVLSNLQNMATHFVKFRRPLISLMTVPEYQAFNRRYNLLKFKMLKTKLLIGANQLAEALYYVRSARHDVLAMHEAVHKAVYSLRPVLTCSKAERQALLSPTASASRFTWSILELLAFVGIIFTCAYCLYCIPAADKDRDSIRGMAQSHMQDLLDLDGAQKDTRGWCARVFCCCCGGPKKKTGLYKQSFD